jgi:hypothetical protein
MVENMVAKGHYTCCKESHHEENSAVCCCTRESALGGRLGGIVNIYIVVLKYNVHEPPRPPAGRNIRRWISTSSTGEYQWITEPLNQPVDIHGEYLSGGLSTEH